MSQDTDKSGNLLRKWQFTLGVLANVYVAMSVAVRVAVYFRQLLSSEECH